MQARTPQIRLYFSLPLGAAGLALLFLTFAGTGRLALGGTAARATVGLALCALAALALCVLAGQGYSRPLVWACLFPVALSAFLRLLCLDHTTLDYTCFLSPWAESFRAGGGFAAIKDQIGNYNVPYLYFLAAASYFDFPDLYAIKLFSVFFDFILAWGGLRLSKKLCGGDCLRPVAAFCLLLLLPTVLLNGAYWGQCDSIYTALLVHAVASALDRKPASSVLLAAAAFSFKLQAIFLIPLWCVFWYSGRVKFRHLLLFPLGCAAMIAPALFLGKPLPDILGVYAGQMTEYTDALTLNAPSVFSLIPRNTAVNSHLASRAGILLAFALTLFLLGLLFPRRRRLENRSLLIAALVLALGVPFLLPYMHERYFYAADALAVVWACVDSRRVFQAAGIQAASLGGYHAYLRLHYVFPVRLYGLVLPMGAEAAINLVVLLSSLLILGKEIGQPDQ